MAIINQIKRLTRKLAPSFLLGAYHYLWALGGALRYGFPSKKIKVIGVTGTNGKSTTIELLAAILKEAGYRVALSSSIKFEVAGDVRKNGLGNSMPGRFALQQLLAQAVAAKCDWAIIEVTSEGIKQYRHKFIDFTGAIFTNLTPEHIESHGSFDNYREAKLELFKAAKGFHVVNRDDENAKYFLGYEAKKKYSYGMCDNRGGRGAGCADICADGISLSEGGSHFTAGGTEITLNLAGEFNIYNALAAIGMAVSQGVGLQVCGRGLDRVKSIPGRMERVGTCPEAVVDYAFTPNALEQVYKTLRREMGSGDKLICLLGACGGGRDKWKRPVLGRIAAKYCDRIILADEDPYDEDPQKIIDMIREGIRKEGFPSDNLSEIRDRRQAIGRALSEAGPDDKVVLTGKGCEAAIRYEKGRRVDWDEKGITREELARLGKG